MTIQRRVSLDTMILVTTITWNNFDYDYDYINLKFGVYDGKYRKKNLVFTIVITNNVSVVIVYHYIPRSDFNAISTDIVNLLLYIHVSLNGSTRNTF